MSTSKAKTTSSATAYQAPTDVEIRKGQIMQIIRALCTELEALSAISRSLEDKFERSNTELVEDVNRILDNYSKSLLDANQKTGETLSKFEDISLKLEEIADGEGTTLSQMDAKLGSMQAIISQIQSANKIQSEHIARHTEKVTTLNSSIIDSIKELKTKSDNGTSNRPQIDSSRTDKALADSLNSIKTSVKDLCENMNYKTAITEIRNNVATLAYVKPYETLYKQMSGNHETLRSDINANTATINQILEILNNVDKRDQTKESETQYQEVVKKLEKENKVLKETRESLQVKYASQAKELALNASKLVAKDTNNKELTEKYEKLSREYEKNVKEIDILKEELSLKIKELESNKNTNASLYASKYDNLVKINKELNENVLELVQDNTKYKAMLSEYERVAELETKEKHDTSRAEIEEMMGTNASVVDGVPSTSTPDGTLVTEVPTPDETSAPEAPEKEIATEEPPKEIELSKEEPSVVSAQNLPKKSIMKKPSSKKQGTNRK